MSIDKLTKLATSLAQQIDNREKIWAPLLATKLAKAAENYPTDSTIIGIATVLNKYADKNSFISRGELRDLYNKFHSRNTKFASLFEEELGETVQLKTPKFAKREDEETEVSTNYLADQVLANALESVFDNKIPLKTYAKNLAEKAKSVVSSTLDIWNLSPSSINVDNGNQKFIVVKANYETPKGITSFYVPVQVIGKDSVGSPTVFIGNGNPQDLNNANVKSYIKNSAGIKLKISSDNVLDVLLQSNFKSGS